VLWIVDYKTSRHEGAGVDAFLDQERERYAKQLQTYVQAVTRGNAGLDFPALKGWREVA